ncbi:peptidase inhibitor family I36 protein [Streptomyces sp. NPDC089915]|uniref:peptidase inhibitor family I36 protein n=1 Tax=Streptomyces sp. NPDC089915 TaxID=3155186 RepID=UPI00342E15B7
MLIVTCGAPVRMTGVRLPYVKNGHPMPRSRLPRRAALLALTAALSLTTAALSPASAAPEQCGANQLCLWNDYGEQGQFVHVDGVAVGQCVPGYVKWPDGTTSNPSSVRNNLGFMVFAFNSSDCSGAAQRTIGAGTQQDLNPGSWSFRSITCPADKVCFYENGDLSGEFVERSPGSSCDSATRKGAYSLVNHSSRAIRLYNSVFCLGAYTIADVPVGGTYLNSGTKITGWKSFRFGSVCQGSPQAIA